MRATGSGSTGATNVTRHAGLKAGLVTYAFDVAKGAGAVFLMRALGSPVTVEVSSVEFTLAPGVGLRGDVVAVAPRPTLQVFAPGGDAR